MFGDQDAALNIMIPLFCSSYFTSRTKEGHQVIAEFVGKELSRYGNVFSLSFYHISGK